jgi:glutamate racemase
LLRRVIEGSLPAGIRVIDSAEVTAEEVAQRLSIQTTEQTGECASPRCRYFATDSVTKFRALGARFLGRAIDGVVHVDLEG